MWNPPFFKGKTVIFTPIKLEMFSKFVVKIENFGGFIMQRDWGPNWELRKAGGRIINLIKYLNCPVGQCHVAKLNPLSLSSLSFPRSSSLRPYLVAAAMIVSNPPRSHFPTVVSSPLFLFPTFFLSLDPSLALSLSSATTTQSKPPEPRGWARTKGSSLEGVEKHSWGSRGFSMLRLRFQRKCLDR